jgi:hypothetical protein
VCVSVLVFSVLVFIAQYKYTTDKTVLRTIRSCYEEMRDFGETCEDVVWDVVPCSLVDIDRRFRGAY